MMSLLALMSDKSKDKSPECCVGFIKIQYVVLCTEMTVSRFESSLLCVFIEFRFGQQANNGKPSTAISIIGGKSTVRGQTTLALLCAHPTRLSHCNTKATSLE